MRADLAGNNVALVKAEVLGFDKVLVAEKTDGSPIAIDDDLNLFSYPLKTSTFLPVLGYPVQITLALVPEVGLYKAATVENASVVATVGRTSVRRARRALVSSSSSPSSASAAR